MYDCDCGFDPPEFYFASIHKSRKERKCFECGMEIRAGEPYERVSGKWEGRIDTFHTCRFCVDLRTWVKNNVPCLCIIHGNQDEENDNAIDGAYWRAKGEVGGLKFGYLRQKVLRDRERKERLK